MSVRVAGLGPRLPRGLKNVGNTCYMNAVLQSLASIPSFHQFLILQRSRMVPHGVKDTLTHQLSTTLKAMCVGEGAMVPQIVKNEKLKDRFMANREQQDSHELLLYLLDVVEEEASSKPTSSLLDCLICDTSSSPLRNPYKDTEWKNPFSGLMKSTLEFEKCNHKSTPSFQRFVDLSLSIIGQGNRCASSLEDCLNLFTTTESVSGVECSTCTEIRKEKEREKGTTTDASPDRVKRVNAKKRITIARAPKVLCLHLNRLIHGANGYKDFLLSVPRRLDIAPYCSVLNPEVDSSPPKTPFPAKGAPKPMATLNVVQKTVRKASETPKSSFPETEYRLVSVIEHQGGADRGHYKCERTFTEPFHSEKEYDDHFASELNQEKKFLRKTKTEEWIYASDEQVGFLEKEITAKLKASRAYMLFYEKS